MDSGKVLPVAELARRCAEEMRRYQRRWSYDPRYCYELFRLALARRDEAAWTALYDQYHPLVRRWIGNAPDDLSILANRAFERFWQALPPDRFAGFSTLNKLLAYLKRCAQSVAIDARRRAERTEVKESSFVWMHEVKIEADVWSIDQMMDKIVGEQLYEQAMECLNSPQERLVFRAHFEWNLKPKELAARWPDTFASAGEVSRIKERILRRLRRNKGLRELLGIDEN